jgi:cob(I)alamin adenosyltransferase
MEIDHKRGQLEYLNHISYYIFLMQYGSLGSSMQEKKIKLCMI